MDNEWDCVIVGGGAAGLSAALVLGRARKRTLVVDAGKQSNLASHSIGGLLGQDGRTPAEFYDDGRRDIAKYSDVELRTGEVVAGGRSGDGFELRLGDGSVERARRVLLATGMDYRVPQLPGLAELWGGPVFACPFCHGWEVRDQPLAVLGGSAMSAHSAVLLRGWSDDVILLDNGPVSRDAAELERLTAAKVSVDDRRVREFVHNADDLEAVVFEDGAKLPIRGLLVAAPLHQRSSLAEQLGAKPSDPGPVVVNPLQIDAMGQTTAPGVFAAGDVSAKMPQLAAAIAAGSLAAAGVVASLLTA